MQLVVARLAVQLIGAALCGVSMVASGKIADRFGRRTSCYSAIDAEAVAALEPDLEGNFIAFRAGDGAAVNRRLLEQGVIVRPIAGYAMPEWLRVSIGLESENARFIDALTRART